MRIVLQRVSKASVRVAEPERAPRLVGGIERGALVLIGVEQGDGKPEAEEAASKIGGLRMFADSRGRMNLDLVSVGGRLLVVSQFTLAASVDRGRRPSFSAAAPAELAVPVIARFVECLRDRGLYVVEGEFGAEMEVELVNDGPVTFVLEF